MLSLSDANYNQIFKDFGKKDWLNSGISEDVINLNVKYIEGFPAFDKFISECDFDTVKDLWTEGKGKDNRDRINGGTINRSIQNKYKHLFDGYWYIESYNPLNNDIGFAQCKPVTPRPERKSEGEGHNKRWYETGKIIKYETPKGKGTPFILLNIPMRVIREVAKKYNIPSLPNDTIEDKWRWIKDNPQIPITVTEGVKKSAALISINVIAVASFSITTHSERKRVGELSCDTPLKPELLWLLENKRQVNICFDRADTKLKSKIAVNRETIKLARKLEKINCAVKIIDWHDLDSKGIDDYLVNNGESATLKLFDIAVNFKDFLQKIKDNLKHKYYRLKSFTATTKIHSRYVSEPLSDIPIEGYITAIKSAKNTGKSTFLKEVKKVFPLQGISPRRKLGKQIVSDLRITYLDSTLENDLGDFDLARKLVENSESSLCCLDSIPKYKGCNFENHIVFIDECESVLESLGVGKTHIKKVRGVALKVFSEMIATAKAVILLDADLSDFTVDYISSLNRNLKVNKVENTYSEAKENNRQCFFFESNNKGKNELLNRLNNSLTSDNKEMVISDSETCLETLNDIYSKKGIRCLLLTSNSLQDSETLERYLENKGELIKRDKIQLVLASPVIQSGISLELDNYFSNVYGIFEGVVPTNIARQMLIRDRSSCPRYIWSKKVGLDFDYSFNVKELMSNDKDVKQAIYSLLDNNPIEDILNHLRDGGYKELALLELNRELIAHLKVCNNLDKVNYLENLKQGLIDEGYTLHEYKCSDSSNDLLNEYKETKNINEMDYANDVSKAHDISEFTAEIYQKKGSLKDKERLELEKFYLAKRLPDIGLTNNFVYAYHLKDKDKVINGIERLVIASNPSLANQLQQSQINHVVTQFNKGGLPTDSDMKYYSLLPIIANELRGMGNTITSDEVGNIVEGISPQVKTYLKAFGINFKLKTPLKILNSIFALFGMKWTALKRNKQGIRTYELEKIELIKGEFYYDKIYFAIKNRYSTYEFSDPVPPDFEKWVTVFPLNIRNDNTEIKNCHPFNPLSDRDLSLFAPSVNQEYYETNDIKLNSDKNEDYLDNLNQENLTVLEETIYFPTSNFTELMLNWHDKPLTTVEGNPLFKGFDGLLNAFKIRYANGKETVIPVSQVRVKV